MDLYDILTSGLDEHETLQAMWDLESPLPPEPEKNMELRIRLSRQACRKLNLLALVKRAVSDWQNAASQWIEFREAHGIMPAEIESIYIYEKGNPVATMSIGGGIWSYVDQDLPFLSDTVCLYDPLGINT